jgi:hypothetical protein
MLAKIENVLGTSILYPSIHLVGPKNRIAESIVFMPSHRTRGCLWIVRAQALIYDYADIVKLFLFQVML